MTDLKSLLQQALDNVWNKGDINAISESYHPDYVMHSAPIKTGEKNEKYYSDIASALVNLKSAFPDFHEVVHDLIQEADKVVARLTLIGTQEQPYMGCPSKGRRFEVDSFDIYRFSDGKIIEQWGVKDLAAMHKQLGWS